ncbi:MAG: MarR family transcriptional regulator [Chloroflexota bacterium]|nr:MarR family transcriptional regulator [Chloroflexota bacterium]
MPLANMTATATATPARSAPAAKAPADLGRLMASLTAATAEASLLNLGPHNLSALEYGILDRCFRGEAQTVTELACVLPGDASVMSRHVSKLVDRGLMGRTRLPKDRRTVRLRLTKDGRALARALAEELQAQQTLLMQGVSDVEQAAFAATAHKILANSQCPPRWGRRTDPASRFANAGAIDERMGNG